jgi:hypothetical protein
LHICLQQIAAPSAALLAPHLLVLTIAIALDMRGNATFITPASCFAIPYVVVVLLPIAINDAYGNPHHASEDALGVGSLYYLLFTVACMVTYSTMRRPRRSHTIPYLMSSKRDLDRFVTFAWCISVVTFVGHLLLLHSVARVDLVQYVTNPRTQFGQARFSGINWAMTIRQGAFVLYSVAWALRLASRPSGWLAAIGGIYMLVVAALAATKWNFVVPLLAYIVCRGYVFRTLRLRVLAPLALILVISLPVAFAWRDYATQENLTTTLLDYNEVFYFAARTMSELKPDPAYLEQGLYCLAISAVPRNLWAEKPVEYDLTNTVLSRHFFGRNLARVRAFTTMGLAEAWIAAGPVGIVLSGVALGALLALAGKCVTGAKSLGHVVFGVFVLMSCYLYLRVSIFDTLVPVTIGVGLSSILILNGLGRIMRRLAGRPRCRADLSRWVADASRPLVRAQVR